MVKVVDCCPEVASPHSEEGLGSFECAIEMGPVPGLVDSTSMLSNNQTPAIRSKAWGATCAIWICDHRMFWGYTSEMMCTNIAIVGLTSISPGASLRYIPKGLTAVCKKDCTCRWEEEKCDLEEVQDSTWPSASSEHKIGLIGATWVNEYRKLICIQSYLLQCIVQFQSNIDIYVVWL
jgi:hypothetical protein